MACFGNWGAKREEINGECPKCGEETIDGEAYNYCSYSPEECDECGCRPCDQSC